jgi:acyl carrier protein
MTVEKFATEMANAIDADPLTVSAETVYKNLDSWDSMGALSIIAMIDENYSVSVGGDDLEGTGTVGALWALVEKRMA